MDMKQLECLIKFTRMQAALWVMCAVYDLFVISVVCVYHCCQWRSVDESVLQYLGDQVRTQPRRILYLFIRLVAAAAADKAA